MTQILEALGPYRGRSLPTGDRYVVAPELSAIVRLHPSSIYRLMKRDPKFPRPVRLSPNRVAWRLSEVEEYLASRPRVGGE